jgi:uncharacterized membrane protein YraQ (UPF0718 family)
MAEGLETSIDLGELRARGRVATVAASTLFAVVTAAALTWAKWWPYAGKVYHVLASHAFTGTSILTGRSDAPPHPSWHAAWSFAVTYYRAIWIALVAALVISAAVEALIPRRWLTRQLSRGPRLLGGAGAGGLAALPSMMCTCCSAPITVTLRRRGVPAASAVAYWVGNPTLNPAVLVFLAAVLPWQWVGLRIVAGLVVVVLASTLARRLDKRELVTAPGTPDLAPPDPAGWTSMGRRFAAAFARLAITLLPEYLLVVLLVGGLRGWLFPLAHGAAHWGVLAIVVFAAGGALFVVPTAGEIPIIVGLLAAGVGGGPTGALLISLPALSLPSLAMVARSLSVRTLAAILATVIGVSVAAGAIMAAVGPA